MYDVIENVRNDELEHVKTMNFCQKPGNLLRANSSIRAQRKAREICDGIVENDGEEEEDVREECDLVVASNRTSEARSRCGVLDCIVKGFEERTISNSTVTDNTEMISNREEKREDTKKA